MKILNAVVVCKRDESLIQWHIDNVEKLGVPMERWFYYGMSVDGQPPVCPHPHHIVPMYDLYENLPVKTYCMFKHALTLPGWTRLLKTDVNSYPSCVNWDCVAKHDMVGYWTNTLGGRTGHYHRVSQPAMEEPYPGKLPQIWCGGPAYFVSRRLATAVVNRGVWYARGHAYEDQMVSLIANESDMEPVDGVGYFTDGHDYRHD